MYKCYHGTVKILLLEVKACVSYKVSLRKEALTHTLVCCAFFCKITPAAWNFDKCNMQGL